MTTFQKIIKYLAIALAAFIIINIASAIFFGLYQFSYLLGLTKTDDTEVINGEVITTEFKNVKFSTLDIDLKYANLTIKIGDIFKVETSSKYVNCKQNDNRIVIEEEGYHLLSKRPESKIIVYIPENVTFDKIKIETGAGKLNIEKLECEDLSFEIGAGQATIENLIVTNKAKIEGGAGKADIKSGEINNLDLDMGVGKFSITSKLTGDSKINAGVGKLDIGLIGNEEDYQINASKGLGSINLNGKEISDDTNYGNGDSHVKIDGGIGSIDINIKK